MFKSLCKILLLFLKTKKMIYNFKLLLLFHIIPKIRSFCLVSISANVWYKLQNHHTVWLLACVSEKSLSCPNVSTNTISIIVFPLQVHNILLQIWCQDARKKHFCEICFIGKVCRSILDFVQKTDEYECLLLRN